MLLVGFGFLMVFVKRYGYGATTGTYLIVAVGLPVYLGLRSTGVLSAEALDAHTIRPCCCAEFAVAAALIAMGRCWGAFACTSTPCWRLSWCRSTCSTSGWCSTAGWR